MHTKSRATDKLNERRELRCRNVSLCEKKAGKWKKSKIYVILRRWNSSYIGTVEN